MTALEIGRLQALQGVRLPVGSSAKGFRRDLARAVETQGWAEITERQADYLALLVWRYRRQVAPGLAWCVPAGPVVMGAREGEGLIEALARELQTKGDEELAAMRAAGGQVAQLADWWQAHRDSYEPEPENGAARGDFKDGLETHPTLRGSAADTESEEWAFLLGGSIL